MYIKIYNSIYFKTKDLLTVLLEEVLWHYIVEFDVLNLTQVIFIEQFVVIDQLKLLSLSKFCY